MSLKECKFVSLSLKNSLYTLEDEVKVLNYLNEHFDITNPEELKSLSINDFVPLVRWLQRHSKLIDNHFQSYLFIYGTLNMQWKDEFFKYIIDQRVTSISDDNWTLVLKEKPFLTKKQITLVSSHAKERVENKGPPL